MAVSGRSAGLGRAFVNLFDKNSSNTLSRLFRSRHLIDLRCYMILICAILVVSAALVFCLVFDFLEAKALFKEHSDAFHFLGIIWGLGGSLLAWIYRSAALRLGVVDLFASEIATICRVGTIVDVANRHIDLYHQPDITGPAGTMVGEVSPDAVKFGNEPLRFSSEENYFTAFSSNAKDLEVLNAYTVNVVTSFYTYMKVVRDYLRRAGQLSHDWRAPSNVKGWREIWQGLIYMEFLAFEAARKAVADLIEYEPSHAENTVTIMLTEVSL